MADDIYDAHQQEFNESNQIQGNQDNQPYAPQPQPQPQSQSQQEAQPEAEQQTQQITQQNTQQPQQMQPAPQLPQPPQTQQPQIYSPAPEFGAYGPARTDNTGAANSAITGNTQDAQNTQNGFNGDATREGNTNDTLPIPFANLQHTSNTFGNPYESNENPNVVNGANNAAANNTDPNGEPYNTSNNNANGTTAPKLRNKNVVSPVFTAIISAAISAIVCLVVVAFAISQGLIALPEAGSLANVGTNNSARGTAIVKGANAPDWRNVARQVSGSVVSIQTRLERGMGKGSGAIISSKGYVVTNNHVIAGAKQIQVTLSNGQMYSATLVGADKTTDLAVLKLNNAPSNLKAAQFADSNNLAVGEPVMAIGNPLGYDDTATTGIVSALNRPVSVMDDQSRSEIVTNAVQIDAAINPGNSGGPTFNAAGQIIGINSSIAATSARGGTAGSIGIGFAIPANLVKRVVSEIIKKGSVKHVALGIMIKSVAVESNGITRGGAQIASVNQGSPAAKAGLQAGDTIVAFDDKPVTNNYALLGYVRATAFNEKATLTVVRGGSTLKLRVTFNQEEAAVNGANRQESQFNKNKKRHSLRNKHGNSSDDDDDDMQQRGDDDGDDGGIFDPFGFW